MVALLVALLPLLLVLLLGCGGKPVPAGDATRPDVVLVSIDTLRADHLSSYGYDRPTSPFLDSLASQGVRFEQARSPAPWTLPAHTSMLTGYNPAHHHVVEDSLRLDPATPVLPERMRTAGYATGGFVATLYVSRVFGFERGFDRFEDFDLHTEKANLSGEVLGKEVVDQALEWLRSLPEGQPFFLFVHVYDVHYQYDPPAPYDTLFDRAPDANDIKYKKYSFYKKNPVSADQMKHQIAQYDESIRYVDDQLARLNAALGARSVRWVVTSDHGEELGERGSWGHAHTLYAEQTHVPLIVSGAGLDPRVVKEAVSTEDIAPTLASFVGQPITADGQDLSAVLAGATPAERPLLADTSRFDSNRVSLLERGLRLEWDLAENHSELFDVQADPAEKTDLAASRPEAVAALSARVEQLIGAPWEAKSAGEVLTEGALLLGGRHHRASVEPGARFAVIPADAAVRFSSAGAKLGPWAMVGGARPVADDPLNLHETSEAGQVELSAEQRAALEALGYIDK